MLNYHELRQTRKDLEKAERDLTFSFLITVFAVVLGAGALALLVRLSCVGVVSLSMLVK